MRYRHHALSRPFRRFVAIAILSAYAGTVCGQTFVPPSLPSVSEQVAVAKQALPAAVLDLLEKGRSFETSGRWADALSCYEEALREFPQDRLLQARFDVARLH